ncbi:hypothetical protein OC846_005194 [Tilletia horrida]|uniref:Uncharacterized protein n=1 Tax=Tilletia horrida TaxID=155126 RepID=A0AAN6JQ57_9BASI|nr:hypothetical protein OC846_005194 [Tilletia horrida]KAK0562377.1 hypothetical protein OC861_005352 [Tilletia horrida]
MPGMSTFTTKKSPSPSRLMRLVAACLLLGAAVSAAPAPTDAAPATYQPPAAYLHAMELAEAAVSAASANAAAAPAPTADPAAAPASNSSITTTTTPAPATTTIGSTTIVGTTTFLPGGDRIEPKPSNHMDSISPGKANEIIVNHLKAQAETSKEHQPARLMETLPTDSNGNSNNPDAAGAKPGAVAAWNQAAGVQHQAEMFEEARKNEASSGVPQGPTAAAAKSRSINWARDVVLSELAQARDQVRREQAQEQLERREVPANWLQASGMAEQAARLQQQKATYAAQVQQLKEQQQQQQQQEQQASPAQQQKAAYAAQVQHLKEEQQEQQRQQALPASVVEAPASAPAPAPAPQAQGELAQAAPAPVPAPAAAGPATAETATAPAVDSAAQQPAVPAASAAPAEAAAVAPAPASSPAPAPAKRVFLRWNKATLAN